MTKMKDAKLFAKVLKNTISILSEVPSSCIIHRDQLWEEMPRVRGCKGGQEYSYMLEAISLLEHLGDIECSGPSIKVAS